VWRRRLLCCNLNGQRPRPTQRESRLALAASGFVQATGVAAAAATGAAGALAFWGGTAAPPGGKRSANLLLVSHLPRAGLFWGLSLSLLSSRSPLNARLTPNSLGRQIGWAGC
jgi:hypothetical protein